MKAKFLKLLPWLLSVPLALIFLVSASGKFDLSGNIAENFQAWGFPLWFMVVSGVVEAIGAIFLLIPRFALLGAFLLLLTMFGSVVTHLMNFSELGLPLLPIGLMTVLGVIVIVRLTNKSDTAHQVSTQ